MVLETIFTILKPLNLVFNWILKKCGRRIVEVGDYKDEVVPIKQEYLDASEKYRQLKESGAKFYLSKINHPGYEKYYKIDEKENKRKYFVHHNDSSLYYWIKKSEDIKPK